MVTHYQPPALLAAALCLAAAGCGGDDEDAAKREPATPTVRSFVGELPGTDALVAVVVPRTGEAQVYVCDGRKLIEFFTGRAKGSALKLSSQDGDTTLAAEIGSDAVTGTVKRATGRALRFEVGSVAEPAGLYAGSISPGGVLRARSATGGELEGRARMEAGTAVIAGSITSPGGDRTEVEDTVATTKAGPFRLIYAQNGEARGGSGKGQPFVAWEPD